MTAQQLASKIMVMFRSLDKFYYTDPNIASLVASKLGYTLATEITVNLKAVCSYTYQYGSGIATIPVVCSPAPVQGTGFSSWSYSLISLLSSIVVNGTGEGLTVAGLKPVLIEQPITQLTVKEMGFEDSWLAVSEYILNSIKGPFVVSWPATLGDLPATVNLVTIQ